jgi:diaminopimelate decarboxylase
MHHFQYTNNGLCCEDVPLAQIAREVGTPAYVYSRQTLERHFTVFRQAFLDVPHVVCFSLKACSNLAILRLFGNLGGGVDIVSGGELYRALKAGIDPGRIVYSGVGKRADEMDAALDAGILMFNVESEPELELLDQRAQAKGTRARIAIRVNPDVDPLTHKYISTGLKKNKFGVDIERSLGVYRKALAMKGIEPIGVDCHIGSQLTELGPIEEAMERVGTLITALRDAGVSVQYLDVGGGLGIPYDQEEPPSPGAYGEAVLKRVAELGVTLILEPGRVLVGNAGVMLARVLYRKDTEAKTFFVVDAAMNDLVRPSLYDAFHAIQRVAIPATETAHTVVADVVGPICESGDFLAKGRTLPVLEAGELIAVMSAGAYGFSMSSNYNSRPRAAEVLVDHDRYSVIRERETYDDLVRGERIPSDLLPSGG